MSKKLYKFDNSLGEYGVVYYGDKILTLEQEAYIDGRDSDDAAYYASAIDKDQEKHNEENGTYDNCEYRIKWTIDYPGEIDECEDESEMCDWEICEVNGDAE